MIPKVWGETECVFSSPCYSRHRLKVLAGGYCSVHWHAKRANRFFVESGAMAIVAWHAWQIERRILTVDNTLVVPSLVPHQFQVLESGTLIEEYWPDRGGEIREDDIVRLCHGGMATVGELERLADSLMREQLHASGL